MAASLHQRLDELLAAEAAGDLSAAERQELDGLLAEAPEAQAERQAYGELLLMMRELPRASMPQRLQRRVMALAEQQPSQSFKPRLSTAVAVGLAGLSALLLWEVQQQRYQLAGHQPPPAAISPQQPRSFDLIPAGAASSSAPAMHAVLTIRPGAATNLLTVSGLPQLAANQTYRLWAQTPQGLQGCMSFVPNAQGSVSLQVPSEPSGSATQVQISVDPITAGSGPEQPGRTVLVSA